MIDDLWILLKKPIASSLKIEELQDILLVKSLWHYNQKQTKMKVQLIGPNSNKECDFGNYVYAFKSINL